MTRRVRSGRVRTAMRFRHLAALTVLSVFVFGSGLIDRGLSADAASEEDFWRGGVLNLRGVWHLYIDSDLHAGAASGVADEPAGRPANRPSELPPPDGLDWSPQTVPAPFDLDLPPRPDGVVTWWHKQVRMAVDAGERPALGVAIGKVNSSYQLWVGPRGAAEKVGAVGSPPPEPSVDYDRHAVWPIPPHLASADSVDLWLRVWTAPQHGDGGGLHEGPFLFGNLAHLVRHQATSELPQLFLAVLFVLLGLFHFELFRRRSDESGYLWLAVVACLFAAYSFSRTQWKYAFGLSFPLLKEAEHVVAFVMVAAFVQLIWTLLDLDRGPFVRAAQGLCLVFALVVIVTPTMAVNHTLLIAWQVLILLLVARGLYLVLGEAWRKNTDARLITLGAILGTTAFVHDIFVERELIDTPRLTAFGFGIFVLFLSATLAEQFARRLREIEDLRRSEEAAERANRAKSQFLANVSHEIRTPMTAILGGTELLLRRELPDDTRDRVDVIRRSASDLLQVIDDILDVSKIEAGKMHLHPENFRPRELVEGIRALFQPDVRARGVLLLAEIAQQVPAKVRADAGRLRQILINLVSNAVKFTEEGTITIGVDYSVHSSTRGELLISVADTGVGIEPDVLPRLFEPFSQADESNSRRVGGTGLGLTISRRLADLMGGGLAVESRPGRGSTFTLTLPVESSDAASVEILLRDLEPAPSRARRILLAEDNAVNALIVTEQLRHLGYEVETATNGLEVLDRLGREPGESTEPVDLILMDCQMPELDGYETTRRVRAQEDETGRRRMPIVALTAHAFEGERQRCLDAGMDDYLSKPFRLEDLESLLERWLER